MADSPFSQIQILNKCKLYIPLPLGNYVTDEFGTYIPSTNNQSCFVYLKKLRKPEEVTTEAHVSGQPVAVYFLDTAESALPFNAFETKLVVEQLDSVGAIISKGLLQVYRIDKNQFEPVTGILGYTWYGFIQYQNNL